jgi:Xaa-Pro aminopeptidase
MDTHATTPVQALSLRERDRRYAAIRAQLTDRGIGGVIATDTDLLYLSNGLPGEMFGFLPTRDGEDFTSILTWRYLADISPQVLLDAQGWVRDLRSGRDAAPVADRIKELGLQDATIGFAGEFSHSAYAKIAAALPSLKIVDVSDIFTNVRTQKSDEELALIDRANSIFDAAIDRIRDFARPGMRGRDIVQEGQRAMWQAGGDMNAMFKFSFGPVGNQNPVVAELCLEREIKPGDIGTMTAHSHFHHYAGHSDQVISFGKPNARHAAMFAGVLEVRKAVMKLVRAGATHRELTDAYEQATTAVGFKTSPHSQMHLYGLDVPEFPGPAYKIPDSKGGKGLGGSGNFVLKEGMVYSISPTLVDETTGDVILAGTAFAVTQMGYRNFGGREPEIVVIE